jgi:serine/threonine protein kinase
MLSLHKLMLRNIHIRIADYDDCWDLRASTRPCHAIGTLGYRAPEVIMSKTALLITAPIS